MTEYNRNVKSRVCGALVLAVLLVSCNNGMRTREAVERDIRKSVGRRGDLNMNNLDVTVNSVNFHGNKADAVVGFMPKGGLISQGMTMRYTLEQRGNEWVIINRQMSDMHAHTGAAGAPGNSAGPLPPGHPSLDGTANGTPK
jgi:hypothetical protein